MDWTLDTLAIKLKDDLDDDLDDFDDDLDDLDDDLDEDGEGGYVVDDCGDFHEVF